MLALTIIQYFLVSFSFAAAQAMEKLSLRWMTVSMEKGTLVTASQVKRCSQLPDMLIVQKLGLLGEAKDTSFLKSFSPLFHADKIVRPLMVIQGANDPRVLKAESDEIVDEARKNNVPVEYMIFNDEGHGLVKKENQQKGYEGVLNFLDKYLKGSAK